MADNLDKKPKKSILKHPNEGLDPHAKNFHWDEMNILATHHPPDKDYGHMKIDEPKTPYYCGDDAPEGEPGDQSLSFVSPSDLTARLKEVEKNPGGSYEKKGITVGAEEPVEHESEEHKKEFENRRKKHYDEAMMMQKARELIKRDLEDLEDDDT